MRGSWAGLSLEAMWRRFLVVSALCLLACASAAADDAPDRPGADDTAQALDFSYVDINPASATHGQRLTLSQLYPQRGVVLNFIASWCGFCWKEIPELQKLHADDRATVVAVAADEGDESGEVPVLRDLLAKSGATIPVLYVPLEDLPKVESFYDYSVLPATYLIDDKGVVQRVFQGKVAEATLEREIRERLSR